MLRVRTQRGISRVAIDLSEPLSALFSQAQGLTSSPHFDLRFNDTSLRSCDAAKPLASLGLRKGDLLQLVEEGQATKGQSVAVEKLSDLDRRLSAKDGRQSLPGTETTSSSAPSSFAAGRHQQQLYEPYDQQLLDALNLKFMSFHAYLKKLSSGPDRGKFTSLEDTRCTLLDEKCPSHPPWPHGICSRCQPPPITLNRQKYRHVDYVEFESPDIINRFLDGWRGSGKQRVGFLYGRYEEYDRVPLGIKAVVSAIYEPPQDNTDHSVQLILPDPNEQTVEKVAGHLGLERVGWMFTDLQASSQGQGKVKHTRYISHEEHVTVLTGNEVLHAAYLQNQHPNHVPKQLHADGVHGSKFVTVVLSGNQENDIATSAYQASTQAMALVRDDMLRPCNVPDVAAVRSRDEGVYVPEVFFIERDEYNNEVKRSANPTFPVEYLHVDLESGGRMSSEGTMLSHDLEHQFPIEHRADIGQTQSMEALARHLKQGGSFLDKMSDFHLLFYLATEHTFSEIRELIPHLCRAIRDQDAEAADALRSEPHWRTIEMLVSDS